MPSTESIDPPAHTAHDAVVLRIQTRQSPYLDVFYNHHTVRMTVDSGATGNMIRLSTATRLGCNITTSSQSVSQADGSSQLHVVGETRLSFTRADKSFSFEGLVVENLDVEVLAGTPFMEKNDIAVRPAKGQIILGDNTIYTYGAHHSTLTSTTARLVTVLRAPPRNATVWPGEFLEITLPDDTPTDAEYALEPRTDAPSARRVKPSAVWPPPGIVTSIAGRIRIPNLTSEPRSLKRNEHFCQVRQLFEPSNVTTTSPARAFPSTDTLHSANVSLDPDSLLPSDIKAKFKALHHEYDQVFDANIEGYNGHVGPFEARVNMGPVEPPQRKGRLPQYAHFASRNAPPCEDEACQICSFVKQLGDSVVRRSSIQDVIDGNERLPFTSRSAWLAIQSECPDLRRTHSHLKQGTRPSKKVTNIKDVKRYLGVATIAKDGLLVVKRETPLSPSRECIIVPRRVLDGVLTALHIQLCHPSTHQLKMATKRYLFALDLEKAIVRVSQACHHCASLRTSSKARIEQSSCDPPDAIGVSFAADVIRRSRQFILIVRECVTSYTTSLLLTNEQHSTLRDALIRLCVQMRPLDGESLILEPHPDLA
ncbi:predicted protein [Nematostella vectensis]|uniref:Uncharacterized protein n=1 Tax=Nematostella vectensis TaxID=45351 RepID=A7SMA0_NEMVE|nr:predicted protein [Nematostella vectensis]|eukprot:XP_001627249.1 predicted protein [Nematostella vectensis]